MHCSQRGLSRNCVSVFVCLSHFCVRQRGARHSSSLAARPALCSCTAVTHCRDAPTIPAHLTPATSHRAASPSPHIHLPRNGPQRGCTRDTDVGDHTREIFCKPLCVARHRQPQRHTTLPSPPKGRCPIRIAQLDPTRLATARVSLVRRAMASRSACATSAMMPTVRSLASGMSTATKRTPESRRARR